MEPNNWALDVKIAKIGWMQRARDRVEWQRRREMYPQQWAIQG